MEANYNKFDYAATLPTEQDFDETKDAVAIKPSSNSASNRKSALDYINKATQIVNSKEAGIAIDTAKTIAGKKTSATKSSSGASYGNEKTGISTGAIILISIGAVVLIGGGYFAYKHFSK